MASIVLNGPDATIPGRLTSAQRIINLTTTAVDYAALPTDDTIIVTVTGKTVTLPTAAGISGQRYTIKLSAVGTGTVQAAGAENIDLANSYALTTSKFVMIQSDGVGWQIVGQN